MERNPIRIFKSSEPCPRCKARATMMVQQDLRHTILGTITASKTARANPDCQYEFAKKLMVPQAMNVEVRTA